MYKMKKLLSNYSELYLTIKLAPSKFSPIDPPWIDDIFHTERVNIIKYNPSFVQLLPEHNIVIIDSPTTTLLQALATKLPVFVLLSAIRWPNFIVSLIEKRAVCANSADDLMKSVNDYIKTFRYPADINNVEFLNNFGNFHSHNSLQIVEKTILKILNEA